MSCEVGYIVSLSSYGSDSPLSAGLKVRGLGLGFAKWF